MILFHICANLPRIYQHNQNWCVLVSEDEIFKQGRKNMKLLIKLNEKSERNQNQLQMFISFSLQNPFELREYHNLISSRFSALNWEPHETWVGLQFYLKPQRQSEMCSNPKKTETHQRVNCTNQCQMFGGNIFTTIFRVATPICAIIVVNCWFHFTPEILSLATPIELFSLIQHKCRVSSRFVGNSTEPFAH